jgi:hypothetical protein
MRGRSYLAELIFLPGIVAGMLLAAAALSLANSVLPNSFEKFVPRQTLIVLAIAIATASILGLVSTFLPSRDERKSRDDSSGGNHVL